MVALRAKGVEPDPDIVAALTPQEFGLFGCLGVVVIDDGAHAAILAATVGGMPQAQVEGKSDAVLQGADGVGMPAGSSVTVEVCMPIVPPSSCLP